MRKKRLNFYGHDTSNMNKYFDVILDVSNKNFFDDLAAALDLSQGEKINVITPQFERTDGKLINYFPHSKQEYDALKIMSIDNLKKIGCQVFDEKDGIKLWLYPYEWYDYIPDGYEVIDIFWDTEKFSKGVTDDDKRCGALSFGFVQ